MERGAQLRLRIPAIFCMVVASVLALGIMTGGVGLRHAVAASGGCDFLHAQPTFMTSVFSTGNGLFEAGEVISVTAGLPTSGFPTEIQILVNGSQVASAPIPVPLFGTVTATYPIPVTGVIASLDFQVVGGSATLDFACAGVPRTSTPTETPTDTPTNTPTNTPTDTPTNTPTVTVTVTASNTPTDTPTDTPTETLTVTPTVTVTVTALPATAVPTETSTGTAATEAAGPVSELPNTGGSPGSGAGRSELWLLLALLAVTGVGIRGLRARQRR